MENKVIATLKASCPNTWAKFGVWYKRQYKKSPIELDGLDEGRVYFTELDFDLQIGVFASYLQSKLSFPKITQLQSIVWKVDESQQEQIIKAFMALERAKQKIS